MLVPFAQNRQTMRLDPTVFGDQPHEKETLRTCELSIVLVMQQLYICRLENNVVDGTKRSLSLLYCLHLKSNKGPRP
eukprot:XP_001709429.1 Hypothetical protein GL50803_24809 [Giardia lamblia ATCC 50803]